jgi:superfamily I DNA/RNA helicase
LEQKELIVNDNGFWRVKFAKREGMLPQLSVTTGVRQETDAIISRLRWLIEEQEVRPEDVQVLTYTKRRVTELGDAIRAVKIRGIEKVHVAISDRDKDQRLNQKGMLTVSTVASAKGYDAYCVLLASANEFVPDVKGRATFYVGCTRAIEHLDVFTYEKKGLAVEMEAVLRKM